MTLALQILACILWLGCCAVARRYQGASEETVPLKRVPWRMLLFWLPVTGLGVALAWWIGAPWWLCPLAALPGLWSWMPGKYNSFAVWGLLQRKTTYKTAEALQGAIGAAVALAIILFAGAAFAHQYIHPATGQKIDARWIMKEPRFRRQSGVHCCGPKDCMPVKVRYTPQGWTVPGWQGAISAETPIGTPKGGLYRSIDGQTWACHQRVGTAKGVTYHLRCVFLPVGGN